MKELAVCASARRDGCPLETLGRGSSKHSITNEQLSMINCQSKKRRNPLITVHFSLTIAHWPLNPFQRFRPKVSPIHPSLWAGMTLTRAIGFFHSFAVMGRLPRSNRLHNGGVTVNGCPFHRNHSLSQYLFVIKKACTHCDKFIDHQTETAPNPRTSTKR